MGKTLVLFDVDGTLTLPRQKVTAEMLAFLGELRQKVTVGAVGGSDLVKIQDQLGENVMDIMDYTFSENGLLAHKGRDKIGSQDIKAHLGEANLKALINFCLRYLADLDIPVKRGTFIEFRAGMINVSPIGRNCSREERDAFEQFDVTAGVRAQMVAALKEKFAHLNLSYAVGGQISFDMFPRGWDKTYCLQFVESEFDEIHFWGDRCYEGGNDFELYSSERTVGHITTGPEDTMKQCRELFLS